MGIGFQFARGLGALLRVYGVLSVEGSVSLTAGDLGGLVFRTVWPVSNGAWDTDLL